MRAARVGLLAAVATVGALVSCGQRADERIADCAYIRLKQNPTTLDPALIVDLDSARIAAKIFNGLVTFNSRLDIVPDLAVSWSISPDGCTYTFLLKQGVTFSTGREVRAEDFQYSFERVLRPAKCPPLTQILPHIPRHRHDRTTLSAPSRCFHPRR